MQAIWLVNGRRAGVAPADRGIAYGDGLFETMAVSSGRIRWLDSHLQRLAEGCRRLAIPSPDRALIAAELAQHLPADGRAVAKLIVTRGTGPRGYGPSAPGEPTRILGIEPWPDYPASHYTRGVAVRVCALRLGENPRLAGLKHLNRLEQVLARLEWDDRTWAEGLLLDTRGFVVGGTMSNVFAVRGATLLTPQLTRCGVRGVLRQAVMEAAPRLGLAVEEADVEIETLRGADELFLTNALFGVWPIRRLEAEPRAIGAVTRRLMAGLGYPERA